MDGLDKSVKTVYFVFVGHLSREYLLEQDENWQGQQTLVRSTRGIVSAYWKIWKVFSISFFSISVFVIVFSNLFLSAFRIVSSWFSERPVIKWNSTITSINMDDKSHSQTYVNHRRFLSIDALRTVKSVYVDLCPLTALSLGSREMHYGEVLLYGNFTLSVAKQTDW